MECCKTPLRSAGMLFSLPSRAPSGTFLSSSLFPSSSLLILKIYVRKKNPKQKRKELKKKRRRCMDRENVRKKGFLILALLSYSFNLFSICCSNTSLKWDTHSKWHWSTQSTLQNGCWKFCQFSKQKSPENWEDSSYKNKIAQSFSVSWE